MELSIISETFWSTTESPVKNELIGLPITTAFQRTNSRREILQELEGMKGKKRHRSGSMDPIAMSDFLKQAAISFGARPEPAAFMTVEVALPQQVLLFFPFPSQDDNPYETSQGMRPQRCATELRHLFFESFETAESPKEDSHSMSILKLICLLRS